MKIVMQGSVLCACALIMLTVQDKEAAKYDVDAVGQAMVLCSGTAELQKGKCTIEVPEAFWSRVDRAQQVQCIATPCTPCASFSAKVDVEKGTVQFWDGTVGEGGPQKFCWLLIGRPK
jgi:hypothetical protein